MNAYLIFGGVFFIIGVDMLIKNIKFCKKGEVGPLTNFAHKIIKLNKEPIKGYAYLVAQWVLIFIAIVPYLLYLCWYLFLR